MTAWFRLISFIVVAMVGVPSWRLPDYTVSMVHGLRLSPLMSQQRRHGFRVSGFGGRRHAAAALKLRAKRTTDIHN